MFIGGYNVQRLNNGKVMFGKCSQVRDMSDVLQLQQALP